MKVRTASGKKQRIEVLEERNNAEPMTPRIKKSYSVTKTSYLQLQLDASGKKRGNLQRNLAGKERRIAQLEKQVREFQEVLMATGGQMRQLKSKYQHQKARGQRAQQDLKDAVQLCREMKQKCQQLIQRNEQLKTGEMQWRLKAQAQERKVKEMKEARKREKREIKELIINMLPMLSGSNQGVDSQEIKKLTKML